MMSKPGSWWVRVFGYGILACAALGYVDYFAMSILYSYPQNMGIVLGNSALALLGLVTTQIGACLKSLEERLERLEGRSVKSNT